MFTRERVTVLEPVVKTLANARAENLARTEVLEYQDRPDEKGGYGLFSIKERLIQPGRIYGYLEFKRRRHYLYPDLSVGKSDKGMMNLLSP